MVKLKDCIIMAFKDLGRRKGRTFLTSIGIAIAAILIVTMVALGSGVNDFIKSMMTDKDGSRTISVAPYKNLSDDEINDKSFDGKMDEVSHVLTPETVRKIQNFSETDNIKAIVTDYCDYIRYNNKKYKGSIAVTGYNEGAEIYCDTDIDNVRIAKEDEKLEPAKAGSIKIPEKGKVIVTEKMANLLGESPENMIGKDISVVAYTDGVKEAKEVKFVISGVIDSNFNENLEMIMLDEDASEIIGYTNKQQDYLNESGYLSFSVIAKSSDEVDALAEKIRQLDYKVVTPEELSNEVKSIFDSINIAFITLGIIVVVVSAISIINTMSMSVIERTKSIGIMKSIGASSSTIKIMFLTQSTVIGFIGGIIGILIGSGLNLLIELIGNTIIKSEGIVTATISIGLPFYIKVIVLIFGMFISLLAGIVPAIRASKMNPVDALRG